MSYNIEKEAWKKVKSIKRFYRHLATFIIMGTFFFAMNVLTSPFDIWFYFPMMPWGVGLAFHYLAVFGIPGTSILSKEWEEEEFERQMDRMDPSGRRYSTKYLSSHSFEREEALDLNKEASYKPQYFKDDLV